MIPIPTPTPMSPAVLSLFFFFLLPCFAQDCLGDTFPGNRVYTRCSSLDFLDATLYWNYHLSNGTADFAYRAPQDRSGFVAWAINPSGFGMIGANALLAFHNSSGAVTVISYPFSGYSASVQDTKLNFTMYSREAEYSNGAYTIYATVALPDNSTNLNIAWQAGQVGGGVPASHPYVGDHIKSKAIAKLRSGELSDDEEDSSRQRRRNIHGVLNVVTWGFLMPVVAIIARYLKVAKSTDPAWFYVHVACQCSAYVSGVFGWALGLRLGAESVDITYDSHREMGISLFGLATLQIFALILRPNKKHKFRAFWNVYHHFVGYGVILLSAANIFRGLGILEPPIQWKHAYVGSMVMLAAIALMLEAVTCAVTLLRRPDDR